MRAVPFPFLTSDDPGTLPASLAFLITGSIVFFFAVMHFNARRRSRPTKEQIGIYLFIVFSTVVIYFDMTTPNLEPRFFHFITQAIGLHSTQALTAVLVVAAGFGAHWFKQTNKLFYGYTEIAFAVVSAILVVTRIDFTGEHSITPRIVLSSGLRLIDRI